jgi:SAM-dependent methyltransferase
LSEGLEVSVVTLYTEDFFTGQSDGSRRSAAAALPVVRGILEGAVGEVRSVLDVGCGVGTWLAEWKRLGAAVTGYDGDYVDPGALQIDADEFVPVNLADPASVPRRRADLTMSLEVAEHLDETHADAFVDLLTAGSDVVLFSAAIPQQGGTGHVNERWPSYWRAKFLARAFEEFDLVRSRLWSDDTVEWWYRQNLLIYARGAAAEQLRAVPAVRPPLDVVHPDAWFSGLAAAQGTAPLPAEPAPVAPQPLTLRQIVHALPGATREAVASRLDRPGRRARRVRT